jgi:hypothetical protein
MSIIATIRLVMVLIYIDTQVEKGNKIITI